MRKWLIFLVVLCSQTAQAVPVWTWVDAAGQVHYSDTPEPGARQIEVTGLAGFSAPPPARRPATEQPAAATVQYQTFSIASPGVQETLYNTGSVLNVLIQLTPPLEPTHRIDVVLDGQRAQLNTNRLQFTLPNVFRGQHTLAAVIVDSQGQVLQTSPPVSFVVQQTSTQNPNSIPGRRAGQNAN